MNLRNCGLVVCTLVTFATSVKAQTEQQLIDRCAKTSDADQKIIHCTAAINSGRWKGKGLSWAFHNRGMGHEGRKDYDRAVADYSEAIRRDPGDADLYYARAHAYAQSNDDDRAISDLGTSIRLNPKNPWAYINRGYANSRKQDYDRAIADYSEAIRLDPTDADPFYARGNAWLAKSDNDRAIADFRRAADLGHAGAQAELSKLGR